MQIQPTCSSESYEKTSLGQLKMPLYIKLLVLMALGGINKSVTFMTFMPTNLH